MMTPATSQLSSRARAWVLWVCLAIAVALACHRSRPGQFPHRLHLANVPCGGSGEPACLSCADCHSPTVTGPATGAVVRNEPTLPDVTLCQDCHGDQSEPLLANAVRASASRRPVSHRITFDHDRHLSMDTIRGQCVTCHGGAVRDILTPEMSRASPIFPAMARCFQCHEHKNQFDEGKCQPCHDPLEVQELLPVTFARHDEAWKRHHERDAAENPQLCQSCHAQTECDDCHNLGQTITLAQRNPDQIERNWVHPADFLTRHAMEAQSQPGTCLTCHSPPSCDACHLERGVSALGINPRNPHPPGWASGNPSSRDFHGRAARRDLASCAACHDAGPATNCIDCHRVGGSGGNPHPRGAWTSRDLGQQMCRYCHDR